MKFENFIDAYITNTSLYLGFFNIENVSNKKGFIDAKV